MTLLKILRILDITSQLKTQALTLAGVAQWIEHRLRTKGSLGRFPVRAHAWVAGQVPSGGCMRGNHTLIFLSLSFSFSPSPLSKEKNKYEIFKEKLPWLVWLNGLGASPSIGWRFDSWSGCMPGSWASPQAIGQCFSHISDVSLPLCFPPFSLNSK